MNRILKQICTEDIDVILGEKYRLRIKKLLSAGFKKDFLSDGVTGLVFAGFGEKEMHPEIRNVEIYGIIESQNNFAAEGATYKMKLSQIRNVV